jgi:hypothetical protein
MRSHIKEAMRANGESASINSQLEELREKLLINLEFHFAGESTPYDFAELHAEAENLRQAKIEIADNVSPDAAKYARGVFETWRNNKAYKQGERILYNGNLYKVTADTVINPEWNPEVAFDYYEPVAKPEEEGTFESPIKAVSGMEYEVGKYYLDGDTVYICTRVGALEGEKFSLHFLPRELIGHYFEEA